MGLGKTVQALVAIGASSGLPAIVVAPASLKINWAREARTWLPDAESVLLDGRPKAEVLDLLRERTPDKRLRKHVSLDRGDTKDPEALLAALEHPKRLLIINYDVLEAWLPYLRERQAPALATACLDELHYAKESRAKRTKAVRALVAPIPRVIGMTGTPILNRPKELLAQLEILGVVKELFGSGWNYLQRYTAARQTSFGWDFSGASNLGELQAILRSRVMVRRLKADVLTELPAKRRHIIAVPASGSAIRLIADENAASERNQRTVAGYRAEVERARRDGRTETYERAVAKLREAERAAFSEMARLRYEVGIAKIPAVIEYLQTALEAGDKIIVFAHHKDVIRALKDAFPDVSVVIDGSTPALARQEAVDRFQSDDSVRLFIGNLIAAGVGITLTASSHVVFAESDWTPGVLAQCEDRAHRIGQRESVLVTHLVWDGSLDARMAATVLAKQKIADRALDRDTPESALPQGDAPDGALPAPDPTPTPTSTNAPAEASAPPADERPSGPSLDELRAPERHRADALLARRRERLEDLARERAALATPAPIEPAQREALHACLRYLADLDEDRARLPNGVGFNRADNTLGHYLADLDTLEPHHATVALALARTYHRQLPPLLHAAALDDARHAA